MILAVDGTAASGKGTLARRLACHFGLAHLDTGALYRAVGLMLMDDGFRPQTVTEKTAAKKAQAIDLSLFEDSRLRQDSTAEMASVVAAMPAVRKALVRFQRDFATMPPADIASTPPAGAVLDGRDIGTVILPDADIKLFIDATLQVRAERRYKELINLGKKAIYHQVLEDLQRRDARDRNRSTAPLKPAVGAICLDTSAMDADQTMQAALTAIKQQTDDAEW